MTRPQSAPQTTRIIGLFPELLGVGGVQEAGRLTAAALSAIALRRGWSTDFLSLNDPTGTQVLEVSERKVSFRGFGRAKVRFMLSAISRARRSVRRQNIIALAAHPNLAFPAAWMQRVAPDLNILVMSHGVEVWKPLPLPRRGALLRANLVLAPSSDTAQKLTGVQGIPAANIRVLPWPVNPSFLQMAAAARSLAVPHGFPKGRVILTVGRWAASERYKGADELIHAIARLRADVPGLHLVVVGGGDDLPRLRRIAADLGVVDSVHFLENLSREEVAACYEHAELFALPSTGEGFGLVFLEAMVFAKPAIGAACGGTTDVVEDGVNGLLVPPHDAERLAQSLALLLRDESLRAQLGGRGAQMVRQKYQFDLFQDALEQILTSCCTESDEV
jgi:glycosyltransferase involved in cell wall biosynthesis